MAPNPDPQNDSIPFGDLFLLFRRKKYWILLSTLFGLLVMSTFALTRPVLYQANASFKDKGNTKDAIGATGIASYLISGMANKNKSDAKTLMMSRRLLDRVVRQLGLQATIQELPGRSGTLEKINDNLRVEYAYLRKRQNYPLPDKAQPIQVIAPVYNDEIPRHLKLVFEEGPHFTLFDMQTEDKIGTGLLGMPFEGDNFSFIVNQENSEEVRGEFLLSLIPMERVVQNLRANLSIIPDPDDDSLLTLSFNDRNRKLSARLLNTLMTVYQDYQREEQNRISAEQISYLNRREDEMGKNLEKILAAYANQLSEDVDDFGFIESEKGMELLSREMQLLRQQQITAELELQRLEELEVDHFIYQAKEQPEFFNELVTKIKELDARSDQIEMALRGIDTNTAVAWQDNFPKQIQDLNNLRRNTEDAQIIKASLVSEKYPLPSVGLMDHPHFMVRVWNAELNNCLNNLESCHPWEKDSRKEELRQYRDQFLGYIEHLLHFLEVSQQSIKERLEHQQAPRSEFQGIDLDTASELYITYTKSLSELENLILQHQFMIEQLAKPGFEISSFSSLNQEDPVSADLVQKASRFAVAIQDSSNHGSKEKERLQTELDTLKKFYTLHLGQTIELSRIKQTQLRDKIESLQNAMLDLVQQQKSILENQLAEAVESQKIRLKQEKGLIARQIAEIQKELNKLPQKWASEKFVEHQIEMNARMVEELTKLVESKNISKNLEIVQSAPLDLALAPVKPARPHLVLFAALGAILGFTLSTGFFLFRTIIQGFPASAELLSHANLKIGGSLSQLHETEMNVLSSVIKNNTREIAMIGDLDFSFARRIADRLTRQGKQLLLIEMGTEDNGDHTFDFDRLSIDESSPEACNLSQVMTESEKQYDYVIVSVSSRPLTLTSKMVLDQMDLAYIILHDETNLQLQPLIQRAQEQQLVFILK